MARNFYRIFTENNPVMGDSKTFGIPEAKGLTVIRFEALHGGISISFRFAVTPCVLPQLLRS